MWQISTFNHGQFPHDPSPKKSWPQEDMEFRIVIPNHFQSVKKEIVSLNIHATQQGNQLQVRIETQMTPSRTSRPLRHVVITIDQPSSFTPKNLQDPKFNTPTWHPGDCDTLPTNNACNTCSQVYPMHIRQPEDSLVSGWDESACGSYDDVPHPVQHRV